MVCLFTMFPRRCNSSYQSVTDQCLKYLLGDLPVVCKIPKFVRYIKLKIHKTSIPTPGQFRATVRAVSETCENPSCDGLN